MTALRLKPYLFNQEEMKSLDNIPTWFRQEYENFHQVVSDPDFPCYFGTIAEKNKEILYTYLDDDNLETLPEKLKLFIEYDRSEPNRHALALFVKPEDTERHFEFYKERLWDILQYLHEHDPSPWPENQPKDPQEPFWNFCFHNEPLFLFANSPAFKNRRSRNLGNSLVIMIQSTEVFNGIEPGTPTGTQVRSKIRERIIKFDGFKPHPDLGNVRGVVKNPWKLYFLSDDLERDRGQCPFHMKLD